MSLVKVFTFDKNERQISAHHSTGLHATRIAQFAGTAEATCLSLSPGGRIGAHPAVGHQVLLIVAGSGWVEGADEVRVAVAAGEAAYWAPGEIHTTGSEAGLIAVALEGDAVTLPEL
jgi:quercetin dioxygenase-like cupin family protein